MPRKLLEGLLVGIDHVGICVGKMDESCALWSELLGVPACDRECVAPQKTEAAFVDPPDGDATVELVSPMEGNAGLFKFLEKRGDGLHHLAFAVTDIREALARLKEAGVPVIDQEPRKGARGHLVAFLHPKAMNGTLVELVERHH
ncbi:MAG: methylmalonyl-CoA epimerase [Deltaproteobacteria bacterium]|nr:methylmalonyl-CoA epimerase [Deltaproteobacteria bacterium]